MTVRSPIGKFLAIVLLVTWPTCLVFASINASGTIASAGTYQQVFAAKPTRTGCTIQNNAVAGVPAHLMYVFAGPIASATHTNSFVAVPVGGTFNCSSGFGVQSDQISIDGGTTGDAFFALQW
jgi:hypothetical protein